MIFQLRVHGATLLNLAPVKKFERSETQIEGRDTAFDIVWSCPRCKHENSYQRSIMQPEHRHYIRVFCRECHSRWEFENKAFGLPSIASDLQSGQQTMPDSTLAEGESNPGSAETFSSVNRHMRRGQTKQSQTVQYVYEKEPDPLMEIRKAGNDLKENPFDPERHVRFADALKDVGAFGAARLHYQQAIDISEYPTRSGVVGETSAFTKYRMLLKRLMSDPEYSKRSETYFVSYSDNPPPHRPSRANGSYPDKHEPEFPNDRNGHAN